jgi:hypothetical protein
MHARGAPTDEAVARLLAAIANAVRAQPVAGPSRRSVPNTWSKSASVAP